MSEISLTDPYEIARYIKEAIYGTQAEVYKNKIIQKYNIK